jgi:uncharacterized protein
MRWNWDSGKDRANRRKHGLGFATAQQVFDDPLALSVPDPYPLEERWRTVGMIGTVVVLVVHTAPEPAAHISSPGDGGTGEETGRIISARKATAHERKAYEEGTL